MADIDDLTGLLARAAFFHRLDEAAASSNLRGIPLCLLVADLDFLKSINDHYGHLAGDAALRSVAGALRAILRGDDVGGRYGGDEFVILLPGVSVEDGVAVAERVRAAVGDAAFTPPGSTVNLRLSLSIGVAAYPLHGHEREALFAAADRAVYAAKEAGRNSIRVASEIAPPPPADHTLPTHLGQNRLVGRHDELHRLRMVLEAACQGRGHLLVVEGEAGIGKTRLVEELASLAGMLGMRVLRGSCHQVESELPYHPFLDALAPLIEGATPDMLQQASGMYAGELARLLPVIRQRLPDCRPLGALPPDEDRMRLQQALCHFLAGMVSTPVALVLEDIHWADEASTRVLNRMAWQMKDLGLLIVCTARAEDVSANQPVAAALANLERQGRCERVMLHPLNRAEMSTLLRAAVGLRWSPDALQRQLIEETGGNPLFLIETVRLLIARNVLSEHEGQWRTDGILEQPAGAGTSRIPLAPTVRAVIETRLARLAEAQRSTLAMAAVLGRQFEPEILAAVMPLTGTDGVSAEDVIYLALEALEQERLVRPMLPPASSYEFTHPLIHQAAYLAIGAARRRALHRHAASILQQRGIPAGTLAEHCRQGDQWAEALRLFARAADEAAEIHAVQSAIGYLERAIEAAERIPTRPEDSRPTRAVELQERLGDLRDLDGDWQGALTAYERALHLAADQPETGDARARLWCKIGDIRGRGRDVDLALAAYDAAGGPASPAPIQAAILLGRARIAYVHASYDEAAALAATARELLGAGPPEIELEARSINALGNAAQGQGDLEGAAAWFQQGIREAAANGQSRWLSHFQHHLARVVWARGNLAAAEQHLLDALALAEQMGDQHTQANCRRTLGVLAAVRGRNDQATEWYKQSLAIAERSGDLFGMVHAHHNLGVQAMIRGDFPVAWAEFDRNRSLAEELADRQLLAGALHGLGRLAIEQGEYAVAERHLRQSLPLCEDMGNPSLLGHVYYLLADLAIEQDKPAESAAVRARARALSGMDPEDILQIDLLDAKALLHEGRPQEAIAGLIETARRIDATGITFLAIDAQILLARAYIDLGEEGVPIAREISATALQQARSHGDRMQEGRALRLLGRATEEQNERARLLDESLLLFREMGAAREAARTLESMSARDP